MQFKLTSIILFVNNISLLEDFYVGILKLVVQEKIENEWLLLSAGSMTLGLHKIGNQQDSDSNSSVRFHSNTKIVFEIEENLESIRKELLSKNIKLKEIVTWDNYDYWLCDGEDPEGNVFQLKQRK